MRRRQLSSLRRALELLVQVTIAWQYIVIYLDRGLATIGNGWVGVGWCYRLIRRRGLIFSPVEYRGEYKEKREVEFKGGGPTHSAVGVVVALGDLRTIDGW